MISLSDPGWTCDMHDKDKRCIKEFGRKPATKRATRETGKEMDDISSESSPVTAIHNSGAEP
jgi:hypothetical protein